MNDYKVLSTKELDILLIEKASSQGVLIDIEEIIEIHPLLTDEILRRISLIPAEGCTILLTSKNAVIILEEALEKLRKKINCEIFCIEGSTSSAIEYSSVIHGPILAKAPDAKRLLPLILDQQPGEIHFFCSHIRRDLLPDELRSAGVMVHEYKIYETRPAPIKVNENYDAVLFFSPSGVESFFSKNDLNPGTVILTIGETTASALPVNLENHVIVSHRPSPEQMIEQLIEYFGSVRNQQIK